MNQQFIFFFSVALCFMTQTMYAQEPQVRDQGNLKIYSTPTILWYCDTMSVGFGDKTSSLLNDPSTTTTINITRDMGVGALNTFNVKNAAGLVVFKPYTKEELDAILSMHVTNPYIEDYSGKTVILWDIAQAIQDLVQPLEYQAGGDAKYFIKSSNLMGGQYTWHSLAFGDAASKSGKLTVNTPDVFYLSTKDSSYITTLERGLQYDLIPIIRTGYPWEDRQAKYNGVVYWSFTDENGNVMKQGAVELEHDPSQINMEQSDTLNAITLVSGLGKAMYFNVTFPDASKETYTVALSDGKAAVVDLGGGLFSKLEISASKTKEGDTVETLLDMSQNPETVRTEWGDDCGISARLTIQKPAYTKYEANKVATSLTGDVTITDSNSNKLITISLGDTYQKLIAGIKQQLDEGYVTQDFSEIEKLPGCSIYAPGEYKYSYNIALNGSQESVVSRSNSVIFTKQATAVEDVHATRQSLPSDNRIFTVGGTFMGTNAVNLPKGIYIQGRKKIIQKYK